MSSDTEVTSFKNGPVFCPPCTCSNKSPLTDHAYILHTKALIDLSVIKVKNFRENFLRVMLIPSNKQPLGCEAQLAAPLYMHSP